MVGAPIPCCPLKLTNSFFWINLKNYDKKFLFFGFSLCFYMFYIKPGFIITYLTLMSAHFAVPKKLKKNDRGTIVLVPGIDAITDCQLIQPIQVMQVRLPHLWPDFSDIHQRHQCIIFHPLKALRLRVKIRRSCCCCISWIRFIFNILKHLIQCPQEFKPCYRCTSSGGERTSGTDTKFFQNFPCNQQPVALHFCGTNDLSNLL